MKKFLCYSNLRYKYQKNAYNVLMLLCAVFLFYQCAQHLGSGSGSIEPACTDEAYSDVVLTPFLGNCRKLGSTNVQPMKVEITVDGFKLDVTNGPQIQHRRSYFFDVDNEKLNAGLSNMGERRFRIQVPRCGTYTIQVVARGKDDSCFECCQQSYFGTTVFATINKHCPPSGGSVDVKGTPRFRKVSTRINTSIESPPAAEVSIDLEPEYCSNCGCR